MCTEPFLPLLPKSFLPTTQTPRGRPKKEGLTEPILAGWPHHRASVWSTQTPPKAPILTPLTQVTRLPTSTEVSGETLQRD